MPDIARALLSLLIGTAVLVLLVSVIRAAFERRRTRSLERLAALSPGAFEQIVAGWLRRAGWTVEVRGGPADHGIDLVARRKERVVAVQCKRYHLRGAVAAANLRDLYGAASAVGATEAVLVTTGRVSAPALRWVEALPDRSPRLSVIVGDSLAVIAHRGRWNPHDQAA